jgi:hypothetical protein
LKAIHQTKKYPKYTPNSKKLYAKRTINPINKMVEQTEQFSKEIQIAKNI